MTDRRKFLKLSALGAIAASISPLESCASAEKNAGAVNPGAAGVVSKPVVVSTWNHGIPANDAAWKILVVGGYALDAVEAGVAVVESDPESQSVGYGGLPDRDGRVTLDACIMNEKSQCGAVAFLEHIENPIKVARKVMEDTPHVMLAGEGALAFALEKGFVKKNLLTPNSEKAWRDWLAKSEYKPVINSENHDTIGMLALDAAGNLCGACTTSGMAYKLNGRVGDSPIIGAGLFIDNEVGAACATGMGEAVIRIAGSAIVVELMRQGKSPSEACQLAVERVISKHSDLTNLQVGFLALSKSGEHGAFSVYQHFNYALGNKDGNKMVDAGYNRTWE